MKNLIIGAILLTGLTASYSCSGKSQRHLKETDATQQTTAATPPLAETHNKQTRVKFERKGGGNLEYEMSLLSDSISIRVTKNQFKETDYTFTIAADNETKATIEGLISKEISCGEEDTTQAPGTFMCGGTWRFAYLIENDSTPIPIFDKEIIGKISSTEDAVREKLEQMENKKSEE